MEKCTPFLKKRGQKIFPLARFARSRGSGKSSCTWPSILAKCLNEKRLFQLHANFLSSLTANANYNPTVQFAVNSKKKGIRRSDANLKYSTCSFLAPSAGLRKYLLCPQEIKEGERGKEGEKREKKEKKKGEKNNDITPKRAENALNYWKKRSKKFFRSRASRARGGEGKKSFKSNARKKNAFF
jgi:hypothetical protein